jgi:hypothetical protein
MEDSSDNGPVRSKTASMEIDVTSSRSVSQEECNWNNKLLWLPLPTIKHPFSLFSLAFFVALAYALIPVVDFWFYYFVKNQYWAILCICCFMEIQELCLMDFPAHKYMYCYAIGIFGPLLIHVIVFSVWGLRESLIIGTYANNIAYCIILLIYVYDVWREPGLSSISGASSDSTHSSSSDGASLAIIYDTFTASFVDNDISESLSINSKGSHGTDEENAYTYSDKQRPLLASSDNESECRWGWRRQNAIDRQQQLLNASSKLKMLQNNDQNSSDNGAIGDVMRTITASGVAVGHCGFYFYSILPRSFFISKGVRGGVLLCSRRVQLLLVFIFNSILSLYFYFLIAFISFFRAFNGSNFHKGVLFGVYMCGGVLFSALAKRIGMMLDRRKRGSASMYFIAELSCLLYYYTFYRVLFESLHSWVEFFLLEMLHISFEWCLYPLRSTKSVLKLMGTAERNMEWTKLPRGSLIQPGLSHSDWLHFIGLEFGIRCVVMVSSCLAILFLFLVIDFVPWVHNSLKSSGREAVLSTELLLVAAVLELINAYIMNKVYFSPNDVSVPDKVKQCFSSPKFAFIAFVSTAILFINPVFVFTTNNTFQ